MKNILIIGPIPPPYNGQSVATQFLAESLKGHFNIKILNISPPQDRTWKSGKFSIKRCFEIFLLSLKLLKYLQKSAIDITYLTISCSPLGHFRDLIFASIVKTYKKPIIIHVHSNKFQSFFVHKLYKLSIVWMLKKVDKIILLSESLFKPIDKYIDRKKVVFIGNSIRNELRFKDYEIAEKLKSRRINNQVTVLFLSNLIKEKGYLDVLSSAIILKKKKLPIKFIFAGPFSDKSQQNNIFTIIKNNNLLETVKFIGPVKYFKPLLKKADVFVLPSYYPNEALPISIIEAMNAGMPIISTNRGAIPDLVRNSKNGLMIKEKSPRDIAEAIETLYSDRDLLINMGRKGRKIFLEKYDINIIADKYIKLFKSIQPILY